MGRILSEQVGFTGALRGAGCRSSLPELCFDLLLGSKPSKREESRKARSRGTRLCAPRVGGDVNFYPVREADS